MSPGRAGAGAPGGPGDGDDDDDDDGRGGDGTAGLTGLRGHFRRTISRVLFDHGITGLSRLGLLHPHARPQRHDVEVLRDVPYRAPSGPGGAHLLDVYRPKGRDGQAARYAVHRAPYPVVLYIHGGAFRALSKDTHWVMSLAFARRGFLVLSINYRLAPQHPFPAALEDAAAAFAYTLAEARRLGGDPSRLVIAGESAGANLALALALLTCHRRPEPWAARVFDLGTVPRVVAPMCGILQVSDPARFARRRPLPSWTRDLLEGLSTAYLPGGRRPAAGPPGPDLSLADPLLVLESDQPFERPLPAVFTGVGTRDPLIEDTRRLERALTRRGVPHEARYYPGEIHAFHALVYREQARRSWQHAYAFIERHLAAAAQNAAPK